VTFFLFQVFQFKGCVCGGGMYFGCG